MAQRSHHQRVAVGLDSHNPRKITCVSSSFLARSGSTSGIFAMPNVGHAASVADELLVLREPLAFGKVSGTIYYRSESIR